MVPWLASYKSDGSGDMSMCCESVTEQHSYQSFRTVALKVQGCAKLEGGTSSNHPAFEDLDPGGLDRLPRLCSGPKPYVSLSLWTDSKRACED